MSNSELSIRALIAPVTPLQQNCTIVWCTKTLKAAIIDPGGEVPRLMAALTQQPNPGKNLDYPWAYGSRRRDGPAQRANGLSY